MKNTIYNIVAFNKKTEELFLVTTVFLLTILFMRLMFAFFYPLPYGGVNFFGITLPYSVWGVILIFIACSAFLKRRERGLTALCIFSLGLGIFADGSWSLIAASMLDYWSIQSYFFILALGSILFYLSQRDMTFQKVDVEVGSEVHKNPKNPFVTVVIPAYNEEKFIDVVLKSLINQTYKNFELVVVDNNSKDKTGEVAKSYGARVVVEKKKGVAEARNSGFMAAKGTIIATTDSDSVLPTTWVERIVQEYKADPKLVGFGGLGFLYSGPVTARAGGRYFFIPFWVIDKVLSGGWNMIGFNMTCKREAFHKIGGFRTELTLGEDVDLSTRLRQVGKVKVDLDFNVNVSGRRYRYGVISGVMTYVPSWCMRVFFHQEKFLNFPAVRSEALASSRFKYVPLAIFAIALLSLFKISGK